MEEEQKKELHSLNEELPQLYINELEQRLETDPLAIGSLLTFERSGSDFCLVDSICNGDGGCDSKSSCLINW
jgi:hypothetical protein